MSARWGMVAGLVATLALAACQPRDPPKPRTGATSATTAPVAQRALIHPR